MVIEIAEYRHLCGQAVGFKDYLRSGPDFDDLDIRRPGEGPRDIDWAARP